ncbi:MAG: 3-methyl-2-oxobutanoate hydroxymethyltransferase, partial [Candidatus Gracilibacteria bacterium]
MMNLKKLKGVRKISVLAAYDFLMARVVDEVGIDVVLVGDSLGMVVLGDENTKQVTIEDMIRHTGAVMKGVRNALVVCDLPLESCVSVSQVLTDARKVREITGCNCMKIEGKPELIKVLVEDGFEVMGHAGLKPQEASGFKVQRGDAVLDEAKAIEKAGAFSIVLECIPADLALKITGELGIPTIGIGAGVDCDGQVLVLPDMLGLNPSFKPRFLRKY